MNYQLIYDLLISRYGTWEKPAGVYTERHRKLPGCMGGGYVKGNAFYVPAQVHLLLHFILVKIHPQNDKLIHAAFRMSNQWVYGTKEYAWVKEKWAESRRGKPGGMLGKKLSPEHKKKISEYGTGRVGTMLGKNHTEETRAKMSKSRKGVPKRGGHKRKLSELCISRNAEKWVCIECGKISNKGALYTHQKVSKHEGIQRVPT